MRKCLPILCWLLMTAASHAANDTLSPIIQPGYTPGSDAKMDERGIWMEMEEAEQNLRRSPLILRDTTLDAYVERVACRVAQAYCADLRYYVVRNPHFNASMAPNGTMLIHTGLLARITSTDQLAAVLGHELAHYTQTHSIKRLRAAKSRMTVGVIVSMGLTLGGVNAGGLPEIFALSSVMGFTRKQESEADTVGTLFLSDAGYRPEQAATIWRLLQIEEQQASTPRKKGPQWLSSHPPPAARAKKLDTLAASLTQPLDRTATDQADPLVDILESNYELLMDEQVKQRDFGRLTTLLDRHEILGVSPAYIAFYRGEAWRLRGGAGDHVNAIEQYELALRESQPLARTHKELGYLLYKHDAQADAKQHFSKYLELEPSADDREMIEFYLGEGW